MAELDQRVCVPGSVRLPGCGSGSAESDPRRVVSLPGLEVRASQDAPTFGCGEAVKRSHLSSESYRSAGDKEQAKETWGETFITKNELLSDSIVGFSHNQL